MALGVIYTVFSLRASSLDLLIFSPSTGSRLGAFDLGLTGHMPHDGIEGFDHGGDISRLQVEPTSLIHCANENITGVVWDDNDQSCNGGDGTSFPMANILKVLEIGVTKVRCSVKGDQQIVERHPWEVWRTILDR